MTLADWYWEWFREMPPMLCWLGSRAGLDRLMQLALRRGKRLTERELYRVQGIEPPPPGVDLAARELDRW